MFMWKAGDDTREKRKVTAGAADDHNTQIVEGLEGRGSGLL